MCSWYFLWIILVCFLIIEVLSIFFVSSLWHCFSLFRIECLHIVVICFRPLSKYLPSGMVCLPCFNWMRMYYKFSLVCFSYLRVLMISSSVYLLFCIVSDNLIKLLSNIHTITFVVYLINPPTPFNFYDWRLIFPFQVFSLDFILSRSFMTIIDYFFACYNHTLLSMLIFMRLSMNLSTEASWNGTSTGSLIGLPKGLVFSRDCNWSEFPCVWIIFYVGTVMVTLEGHLFYPMCPHW